MSAICGIIHLDGAPADAAELERMADALAYRGPDGIFTYIQDEAALAGLLFWTTPESLAEGGPQAGPDGTLLVADARLDNREELIAELGAQDAPSSSSSANPTDPDLILAAYRRWGEDCPKHLIGDFAFAVYEPEARRLFLARDSSGMRQLVYHADRQRVIFATGAGALLAVLPPQDLNLDILQDMAAGVFDRFPHQTPFRDIQRLPPAHCLTITTEGARLHPYWTFGEGPDLSRMGDDDLAEALAELLERVMRAHLRSYGGAAIASGGGLDSSGLVGLANRLAANNLTTSPVWVATHVFPATPGSGDEYFRRILADESPLLRFMLVDCDEQWFMKETPEERSLPYEDLDLLITDRAVLIHMLNNVRAEGCRAFLIGYMGDQVLGEWSYRRPTCLGDYPLRDWPAELHQFQQASGHPGWRILSHVLAGRVLGRMPRKRLWRAVNRWRPTPLSRHDWARPAASVPEFLPPRPGLSAAANYLHSLVVSGRIYAQMRAYDQTGAFLGIEPRMPFLDRRVLNFAAGLDARAYGRDGVSRYLFRQAMRGRMPEAIRTRTSKEQFMFILRRGLDEHEKERIQDLIRDPLVARLGLVDKDAWQAAWQRYWAGDVGTYAPLLLSMCVELWLQRMRATGSIEPIP